MKYTAFFLTIFVFLSNSWSDETPLKMFCENLDTGLRSLQPRSKPTTCSNRIQSLSGRPYKYQGKSTTLLSPDEAQSLFKEMAGQEHIAFKFPADGCAERADEMTRLMLLKGVKPLKGFLWVEPTKGAYTHYLQLADKKHAEDPWRWTQHTAPVIIVQEKGKAVPYIIDPSTETKAVPYEQWKKNLSQHAKKKKFYSEIGRTGQWVAGSPVDMDFQNPEQLERLRLRVAKFKAYEKSSSGLQDYIGDELWDRDNNEGKIDAMSGGN